MATPDSTARHYDASGNVSRGFQQVAGIGTYTYGLSIPCIFTYGGQQKPVMFLRRGVRDRQNDQWVSGIAIRVLQSVTVRGASKRSSTTDGRFPALPTEVIAPNGLKSTARASLGRATTCCGS